MRLTGDVGNLALGIEEGLEPQGAFADDGASGVVTTRVSSWWTHRRCTTCGHTFRRGDKVLVDPVARTVAHLAPELACAAGPVPADGPPPGADRDEFARGLMRTWPPGVTLTRLEPGDWRLPRRGGSRRQTPTCLYCGHTFRAGEYVVVCPCKETREQPAACGAAVHRDPAAGLPCWESWRPSGSLAVCPTTSAKL